MVEVRRVECDEAVVGSGWVGCLGSFALIPPAIYKTASGPGGLGVVGLFLFPLL
jgi:hypothetical protein